METGQVCKTVEAVFFSRFSNSLRTCVRAPIRSLLIKQGAAFEEGVYAERSRSAGAVDAKKRGPYR